MELEEYIKQFEKVGIAFSGGVDSVYLLYAASAAKMDAAAYYVKTPFQPRHEFETAIKMASRIGLPLKILEYDILQEENVISNTPLRCYYCKQRIFGRIIEEAKMDGITAIFDGTNASDNAGDRPGMKALSEMKIISPLRACGLTKDEIRRKSYEAGLETWDKPSYSCLATRVCQGERIDEEKLRKIETAEDYLMERGFRDVRVRLREDSAAIEVEKDKIEKFREMEDEIIGRMEEMFTCAKLSPISR